MGGSLVVAQGLHPDLRQALEGERSEGPSLPVGHVLKDTDYGLWAARILDELLQDERGAVLVLGLMGVSLYKQSERPPWVPVENRDIHGAAEDGVTRAAAELV